MNRRDFLRAGAASVAVAAAERQALAKKAGVPDSSLFPENFVFGVASSCVQIEGAPHADGKSASIWDVFAQKKGVIRDGSNPSVACESYYRWREDNALLKELGVGSYRLSIAWPRIVPDGVGKVNARGVDHYSRILDALLEMGVRPLVTIYHWDLPQVLQDKGGWTNRETADYYAEYVHAAAKHFGDRVKHWCLLNEPQAFTVAGYGWGVHAPGIRDRGQMLRATHTANLAQGAGYRALKAVRPEAQVGIAHDFVLFDPATNSKADRAACRRFDAFRNRWFLEPALTGHYPEAFVGGNPYKEMGWKSGDEERLRAGLEFSGMNFYGGRSLISVGDGAPLLKGLDAHVARTEPHYAGAMERACHWMAGLAPRPVVITETGFGKRNAGDEPALKDPKRIAYLRATLEDIRRAQQTGARVEAVHVWCLMDDWEWNAGYTERLGLAWVDYGHPGKRTLKESGHWYRRVVKARRVPV